MVSVCLAKAKVAGSNPVFRSNDALGGVKLIHFGGEQLIRPEVQYSVYLLRASLG